VSDNMKIWEQVSRPPAESLKKILGGRLAGMTDVNPQWRLKVMTEGFGQIGIGWYYEVVSMWTEQGAGGELMAFVHIHLYTTVNDGWSKPISGIGGSMLVAQEKNGLHTSDEAYKMATTDALSVAMKQLGVAADIYAGLWDGSKYKDAPKDTPETVKPDTTKQLKHLNDASSKGTESLRKAWPASLGVATHKSS